MLILKCTRKVSKELGVKRGDLPQISRDDNPMLLGDWFVNSLRWGHTKILLFANAETLYSFLVEYRKKDLRELGQLFRTNLKSQLLAENFELGQIERLLAEYQSITLAQTDNRSVLGSMNDLASMYQYWKGAEGGEFDLIQAGREINRTPQLKRGGRYSIDLLREKMDW
jgi:hypothetical protein